MISKDIIESLAAEELVDANTKHEPRFNSPHEAYAVIKEELEEMQFEVNLCEGHFAEMWKSVKTDEDTYTKLQLKALKKRAIFAAQEAIQVVAMCDKALKLY